MSISLVICRCDSDLRMSISLCKLSNSLAVRMSLLTALIATVSLVSYVKIKSMHGIKHDLNIYLDGTYLMVSFINSCEAPFTDIGDYDIGSRLVIFCSIFLPRLFI
jgi:hypothetical protein